MTIRTATIEDLDAIVKMEYECFPETDAVPASVLEDRIRIVPGHFWLMLDGDRIVSFVDGFTTDEPDILDEMYERAELHNEDGRWQMLFGFVNEGISDKSFHGGSRWNQMRLSL